MNWLIVVFFPQEFFTHVKTPRLPVKRWVFFGVYGGSSEQKWIFRFFLYYRGLGLKGLIRRTACIVASYDRPGTLRFFRMRGERPNNCFIVAATILSEPIGSLIIYIAEADPEPAYCLIYFVHFDRIMRMYFHGSQHTVFNILFTLCSHNKNLEYVSRGINIPKTTRILPHSRF